MRKATKEEAAAFLVTATYAPINNPTFTGTVGLATADFNVGNAGGEVSWNNQEKTLDLVTGSDNVTIQVGQEVLLYARNNSGSAMSDGQVVIISGSQGNRPTISLAQANTVESARKTIGVVTQPIPNNSNGFVTLIGKVRGLVLDSGTFTEGEVVYLSDTVAGGITNVKPDIVVEIGHILATSIGGNTNGVLEVQINNESSVYDLEQTLNASIATKAPKNAPQITGGMTIAGTTTFSDGASSIVVSSTPADPQNITNFDTNGNNFVKTSPTVWFNNDNPTQEIRYTGTRWELQDLGSTVYYAVNGSETYPWEADWSQTGGGNLVFTNFVGGSITPTAVTLDEYAVANSDSCIYASSGGNLQEAYDLAKALTPNGNALSETNRATLVITAGHYTGNLNANNAFVDIYGLGHQPKVVGCKVSVFIDGYITNTQNGTSIAGIQAKGVSGNCGNYYCTILTDSGSSNKFSDVATIINCDSNGDICLGGFSGIALNVIATSFVNSKAMAGRMENCETKGGAILQRSTISGIVINCRGSANSFQFGHSEFGSSQVSGTIKQCTTTASNSFGAGTSTALFEDCVGGFASFGNESDSVSGTYVRCKATGNSFGYKTQTLTGNTLTVDGTFIDCEAGTNSFGYTTQTAITVTFDGTAKGCVAGYTSFGSAQGAAGTNGTGKIGANALIENCTGSGRSFGRDENLGKVLRCTATFPANPALVTFRADGTTGKVRLCLDGTYTEQNIG